MSCPFTAWIYLQAIGFQLGVNMVFGQCWSPCVFIWQQCRVWPPLCTGLSSQIEDNSGQCCENEQSIGSYLFVSVLVSLNWGAFSHTEPCSLLIFLALSSYISERHQQSDYLQFRLCGVSLRGKEDLCFNSTFSLWKEVINFLSG